MNNWDARFYDQRHSYVWQYGSDLLPLLDPKPGERILDAGCGTCQLTQRIAEAGALVHGIDRSGEMIGKARAEFPGLSLEVADITRYQPRERYDAVFSNAVLHWVTDAAAAARTVAAALAPGGRFVAEFGGRHNLERLLAAIAVISPGVRHPWYFPGIDEYGAVLAAHGLELRQAFLFERMTKMEDPQTGLRDWMRMFGSWALPPGDAGGWLARLEDAARPALFRDGHWWIDYWRLRIVAVNA